MTSPVSANRTSSASSTLEQLHAALDTARLRAPSARFSVISVPVPAFPAEALLSVPGFSQRSFFAEPSGYEHAALGELSVLEQSGPDRFRALATQAQRLFTELDDPSESLRLFGGFAFQPGRSGSETFRPFGEARFSLPRLVYERREGQARLSLILRVEELSDLSERARAVGLVERALIQLSQAPVSEPRSAQAAPRTAFHDQAGEAEFTALVQRSREAILRGDLEKVVLARRVDLQLSEPVDVVRLLTQLAATAPECIRYAFEVEGRTFLGATPERLVKKQGSSFDTEAVAGSLRVDELSARSLLESTKDRAEHAIVVREVLQSLRPLCATLEPADTPEIHRLRHVAHLRTRIRGRLLRPEHVLELVARLHPTPAVGGFPSARAQAWIAEHEPAERGWYAGPIGWVDRHGDGAFVVALRCGVFSGNHAALFAGAGIVEGSNPDSELQETRWKLQALLGALGVRP